ncbi:MAG: hypothetical protein ACYDBB_23910 [Armatimonadota bacterium]
MQATRWHLLALLTLCIMGAGWAAEQSITLKEHLNVDWKNELLTYPFTAPKGACTLEGVSLTGPHGVMPVQLTQVDYWPGTKSVKSARLAFVTDLAPLATDHYTVRIDKAPAKDKLPPLSDLHITPGQGQVEIANNKFGVRMLLGEKQYPAPMPSKDVPGPVVAMRLADGTWFGGSRMYGLRKIKAYSAALTEKGAVLGRLVVRYTYEDDSVMEVAVQLAAASTQATWDMNVTPPPTVTAKDKDQYDTRVAGKDGWEWLMSPGLTNLQLQTLVYQSYTLRWGKILTDKYGNLVRDLTDVDLAKEPVGPLVALQPWAGWWNQQQQSWFNFSLPGIGTILSISSLNPEIWIEPNPDPAKGGSWNDGRKDLKLLKGDDGAILFRIASSLGLRKWTFGGPFPTRKWKRMESFMNGCPLGIWSLDRVKDLVLDWPGDVGKHPRLFINKQDLERVWKSNNVDPALIDDMLNYTRVYQYIDAPTYRDPNALLSYLLTDSPEIAKKTDLLQRMRIYLGQLGNYDRMRQASQTACIYDGLADSNLISPRERKLFQAQLAYLAYACADAGNWSFPRGFCSGNQNMTVAHVLNMGLIAASIPEHPMSKKWSEESLQMMEEWLTNSVGPNGEWPESMANYAEVSAAMIVTYAVAAKNAGIHDYVNDPRLKKLMLYITRQYTPPDPRPFLNRTAPLMGSPPSGRGPAYHQSGLSGMMAKATAASDPEFSRIMQWHWLRGGKSTSYLSDRMSGLEEIYMDPSLPAAAPKWTSERFPQMGAILRQGVGDPLEYYINFILEPRGYVAYYSESGGFAGIWAKGAPIAVRFAGHGYAEREEILISRVLPAREVGTLEERKNRFMYSGPMSMTDFAALNRQDYLAANIRMERPVKLWHGDQHQTDVLPKWPPVQKAGAPPVDWRRQVLFIKDTTPMGAGYLLLRDTVSGNQPTMWQFWTLSEKIGTPEEVKNLDAFLADKPGYKALDSREIKGDRFTAIGQQGVDVEYYIASPTDTPRHTLRWGHTYYNFYSEYQDLLHLQLPGDGAYFVALFPRKRTEPAPAFQTLGDGKIIKVKGTFGTDYGFLAGQDDTASAENITFHGTAASVQDRPTGLVLSLGAKGDIRAKGYAIACDTPASLRVGQILTVEVPSGSPATIVNITAPGEWLLAKPLPGVTVTPNGADAFTLTIPAGMSSVMLVKK